MAEDFPTKFAVKILDADGNVTGYVMAESSGVVTAKSEAGENSALFEQVDQFFSETQPKLEAIEIKDGRGRELFLAGHS